MNWRVLGTFDQATLVIVALVLVMLLGRFVSPTLRRYLERGVSRELWITALIVLGILLAFMLIPLVIR